uniref:Uncharacterized protein n=1 Tax=Rhizophora mucronata TaxID=61149 RepID=A0A2P2NXC6_RHIMU
MLVEFCLSNIICAYMCLGGFNSIFRFVVFDCLFSVEG